jgi:hypothetical protein
MPHRRRLLRRFDALRSNHPFTLALSYCANFPSKIVQYPRCTVDRFLRAAMEAHIRHSGIGAAGRRDGDI